MSLSVCYNFLTSSLLPFLFLFCQSTFPISTGGTPLLYLSFPSEQPDTRYTCPPSFFLHSFHLLHSLMHSGIASKAVHSFTIRYLQVGYLYSSLDLNVL